MFLQFESLSIYFLICNKQFLHAKVKSPTIIRFKEGCFGVVIIMILDKK